MLDFRLFSTKGSENRVVIDERVEDPGSEMASLAQASLPLNKCGFRESARFVTTSPKIIYDSQWCRVKIIWNRWKRIPLLAWCNCW